MQCVYSLKTVYIVTITLTGTLADAQVLMHKAVQHVKQKADNSCWYLFRVDQVKPLMRSNLILEVLISSDTHLHSAICDRRSVVIHGGAGTAWLQTSVSSMTHWHIQ